MKRGRPRKNVRGLEFPGDAELSIRDVGEDGVSGGSDYCGNCGEPRGLHLDGRGPCGINDCKRFRGI
jgi:hypothetical protein